MAHWGTDSVKGRLKNSEIIAFSLLSWNCSSFPGLYRIQLHSAEDFSCNCFLIFEDMSAIRGLSVHVISENTLILCFLEKGAMKKVPLVETQKRDQFQAVRDILLGLRLNAS